MHVALFVDHARVPGIHPASVEPLQVALVEALVVVEERGQSCRSKRHAQDDIAHGTLAELVAFVIHDPHIESRHGLAG